MSSCDEYSYASAEDYREDGMESDAAPSASATPSRVGSSSAAGAVAAPRPVGLFAGSHTSTTTIVTTGEDTVSYDISAV
jgi:hypothetical protein